MDTYVFTTSSAGSFALQSGEKFYKFFGIFFIGVGRKQA
jgi:hypothetical protein